MSNSSRSSAASRSFFRLDHLLSVALARGGRTAWDRVEALVSLGFLLLVAGALLWALWFVRPVSGEPLLPDPTWQSTSSESANRSVVATGGAEDPLRAATAFDSRKLFRAPPPPPGRQNPRSNVTLSESIRHLSLLGILGGNDPRAIVTNSRTGQTLHVRPGDFIGEIQIQEVDTNRVLLRWKKETLEWTL